MSVNKFKAINGGQTIRIDALNTFTYDHNDHNGATLVVTDNSGIGSLSVALAKMAEHNNASLKMIVLSELTITDGDGKMAATPTGTGTIELVCIDGYIYCSAFDSASVSKLVTSVGDYDPDSKGGQTIAEDIDEINSMLPSEATYVAAKAASCEFEYDDDPLTKIAFGAKLKGVSGNSLEIAFVIGGDRASEVVTVEDGSIKVDLAYADSAITSTMASVKTAIEAHEAVNALISVVVTGDDSTIVAEDAADFTGGVDGVAGDKGKIIFDADAVYIAIAACTVSNSDGWKKIADLS